MKIGIWNYGFGNIASVRNALNRDFGPVRVFSTPESLEETDLLVLPGVGSFGEAMKSLRSCGAVSAIKRFSDSGRPIVGICLGAQILFEQSDESPGEQGLGLIKGRVNAINSNGLKTHQGWFKTKVYEGENLVKNEYFFYSHGFKIIPEQGETVAIVNHGNEDIVSALKYSNSYCIQFHPEKSAEPGLLFLSKAIKNLT